MGNSHSKDQHIDLYIYIDKQYYTAGDYVEGEVYLYAKKTREYSNICLKIEGEEFVEWTEGSGESAVTYRKKFNSYNAHILLVDFHGTVNEGQYRFPFTFLLPNMMNGSFYYSQNCYIKYLFRVELVHPTKEKHTQIYEMHLNILEPPRMPIGAISTTNEVNSKCCGCCFDYGNTIVSLNCEKNFVMSGDKIAINGFVNNLKGKENIKSFCITLEERVFMAEGNATHQWIDAEYPILVNDEGISSGTVKEYSINWTVPSQINHYTSIGSIVARYFVIHLKTKYGCCSNTAEAFLHIIVHSKTPMIVEKKEMPMPQNWNPKEFPKITCTNLPPFSYLPSRHLPFLNMPGNENITLQIKSNGYPSIYEQYHSPPLNFIPPRNESVDKNNKPTYYNQDIFSESEKYQQGYKGQQPYFNNPKDSSQLIRRI